MQLARQAARDEALRNFAHFRRPAARIGVKTGPGATQFTLIPSGPWSIAMAFVRPITAAFEVV